MTLLAAALRHTLLQVLLCVLVALALSGPLALAQSSAVRVLDQEGLTLVYPAELERYAADLWATAAADRVTVSERLGIRPDAALLVLFGTQEGPHGEVFPPLPANSSGAYFLGTGVLLLAAPGPSSPDLAALRSVLRHELVHALLDAELREPIPRWLNEGLATLLSGELQFLDETVLTLAAFSGQLLPLRHLAYGFPTEHRQRTLAYAEAASFARYLLAREGMPGLHRLVAALDAPEGLDAAFAAAYGRDLAALELDWASGLAGRFSILGLVALLGSGSLLGIISTPLLLVAWWRRRKERRQDMERLAREDAAEALALEADAGAAPAPPPTSEPQTPAHRQRATLTNAVRRWKPPGTLRPPRD